MGRHISFALSLVLLFSCAPVWARTGTSEYIMGFKIYGQQLIVVQGSIGLLERRNFVIDTGAYPTVIDRDVAEKLSLSGHREELDTVDRTVSGMAVAIPQIDVGPIHATQVRSLVQDLSDVSRRAGLRIDALVGLDVLAHSSFRIDYAAKKIVFGPIDPLPSSVPFHLANGKFCVDLQAGSKQVRMLVDTGAEKVMLIGSHVPWLSHSDRARAFTNLGGSFALREVRMDTLQLGDTDLNTEPVYVSDRQIAIYSFDGFLSTIQFRQIAFDFERGEFGWIPMNEKKNRVHVASKAKSKPPFASALANEVSQPRHSVVEGCGDPANSAACGLR
ncbi:MAG TPA: retropepsin-like aspartic protease [Terriglobales bacterium]|nr:retropepsin-like aspartic protease [Terriglobales bacterium]